MAGSLSDLLIARDSGTAIKGPDIGGALNEGLSTGIKLATAKDEIEQKKAQTEAMKNDLVIKQASTVNSLLTNLARANPMIAKKMLPQVREKLLNLGVSPDIADYTVSDDAIRQRQIAFSMNASGKLLSDPASAQRLMAAAAEVVGWDQAGQMYDNAIKMRHDMTKQDKQIASNEKIAGMQMQAKEDQASAKEKKEQDQALRLSVNKFEEIIKKDREALGSLEDSSKLLATGGPIAQSAARRALAKAYNSGALTDNDVNDFAGSKALAERFKQMLETGLTGEITDENLRGLLEVANKSAERRMSTIKANAKDAATRYARIYGGDPAELEKNVFLPQEFLGKTKISSMEDKNAPPKKTLSQAVAEAKKLNPAADEAKLREVFSKKGLVD